MDLGEETITYPCRYRNKTNYLSLLIWWEEELLLTHVDTGEETIAYTCGYGNKTNYLSLWIKERNYNLPMWIPE